MNNTGILQVAEFEEISVGNSGSNKQLSVSQAESLSLLSKQVKESGVIDRDFFVWTGRNSIKMSHYVGVIQVDGFQLEILPKVSLRTELNKIDYEESFISLMRMISYVYGSPRENDIELRLKQYDRLGFLDMLVLFYLLSLKRALNGGLHFRYEEQMSSMRYLAGKILIEQQIHHSDKSILLQQVFVHSANNELMKYFKTTNSVLLRLVHNATLRRSLSRINHLFDDCGAIPRPLLKNMKFHFDRLNAHFKTPYEQSKLILNGLLMTPNTAKGLEGIAVLFDMNKLFEKFFSEIMARNASIILPQIFNPKISVQEERLFLIDKPTPRTLKPDIVISCSNNGIKETIILDTKNKIVEEGRDEEIKVEKVHVSDLYQMFAYATKYCATTSILVYPSTVRTDKVDAGSFDANRGLKLWTIQVFLKDDNWESTLVNDLRNLFDEIFNK